MKSLIDRVDSLYETLKQLLPMKPEHEQRLDKKFRLEFNYNSNHIEGNTLTYGETELLLIFGDTKGNHSIREYEEMKAHDVAFNVVKEWAEDKEHPLTETYIKNLNRIILFEPFWKDAITPEGHQVKRKIKIGDYKDFPNSVRLSTGEIFEYASVSDTPILMGELIEWFRTEEEKKELHPAQLAALLQYKFVRIHPFDDGNGRIVRLLTNYVLLKNNLPPVVIKSADKQNYIHALRVADTGDINSFIEYIIEQLIWSLELSIKAARGESIDEPGDLDKKISLLKRKLGEKDDEKIKMKYGVEAIKSVVENSITPLLKVWERRLKDFDPLFMLRKVYISLDDKRYGGNNFEELLITVLKKHLLPNLEKNILVRKMIFQTDFTGLRNINKSMNMNGGEITFAFYENAYEKFDSVNKNIINRLYHQPLKDKEIENIIETIGTWLYRNIEQVVENEKENSAK